MKSELRIRHKRFSLFHWRFTLKRTATMGTHPRVGPHTFS
ncbi:unnamed protein product [Gulo gulo]|uniref:Uncharacterized protein n=1 Tax=Gulo gulo TaxID=48420 RepID=A0A9X9LXV4_GULGU|nr:unnamed protein product [Gulo gulo]